MKAWAFLNYWVALARAALKSLRLSVAVAFKTVFFPPRTQPEKHLGGWISIFFC